MPKIQSIQAKNSQHSEEVSVTQRYWKKLHRMISGGIVTKSRFKETEIVKGWDRAREWYSGLARNV